MYNFDFARRNTRSIFEKRRLFCSRLEGPHRGPSECPSTRERRVQGAVEGSFICSSGLPFLLPARGPLTSPLLLLANCDAADTLVMFSASFVRPLPAPNLPLLPAAHTIFGIAGGGPVKRETRRRIYFASGMLLPLLPSYDGIRRELASAHQATLFLLFSRPRGAMILIRNSIGFLFSFF